MLLTLHLRPEPPGTGRESTEARYEPVELRCVGGDQMVARRLRRWRPVAATPRPSSPGRSSNRPRRSTGDPPARWRSCRRVERHVAGASCPRCSRPGSIRRRGRSRSWSRSAGSRRRRRGRPSSSPSPLLWERRLASVDPGGPTDWLNRWCSQSLSTPKARDTAIFETDAHGRTSSRSPISAMRRTSPSSSFKRITAGAPGHPSMREFVTTLDDTHAPLESRR